ncbi:hypothetical protein P6P90_16980 [Ectobacillus antri]|uniref:Uncharacterized protein n=1 Tax=Ectobacillus antri TaxID=2486280 RepID=A0ABT6HB62_9BACI|nr:hypothetical protein [Ectobacillus antri]MDG4658582.1 hypothetical protein [Ectobacillus antri]MDG5755586.1 hypothetical protein [Ectobacillus antri]
MSFNELLAQVADEITKEDVEKAQKSAVKAKGTEDTGMLVRMFAAAPANK